MPPFSTPHAAGADPARERPAEREHSARGVRDGERRAALAVPGEERGDRRVAEPQRDARPPAGTFACRTCVPGVAVPSSTAAKSPRGFSTSSVSDDRTAVQRDRQREAARAQVEPAQLLARPEPRRRAASRQPFRRGTACAGSPSSVTSRPRASPAARATVTVSPRRAKAAGAIACIGTRRSRFSDST